MSRRPMAVAEIVERVRVGGEDALRELARRSDGLVDDAPLFLDAGRLVTRCLPWSGPAVTRRAAAILSLRQFS